MKKTMWKAFAAGMLIVLAALIPACRPKPKVDPTRTQTTATDTAPPDISATAETPVRTETDFVSPNAEAEPTAETLPRDIEALNRVAQDRGFIRDAYFGYDEAALSSAAQAALTTSASWLRQNPQYNLLIEGHCDERGTEQYNLALGDRRANTVRDYLMALGIEASRMRTVSYGEERPFDEGHDESAWAKNRRAHLVLVNPR